VCLFFATFARPLLIGVQSHRERRSVAGRARKESRRPWNALREAGRAGDVLCRCVDAGGGRFPRVRKRERAWFPARAVTRRRSKSSHAGASAPRFPCELTRLKLVRAGKNGR